MSNLNQNTMVTLLNSSTISGVVNLPLTTNIPFRSIIFKDFNGYTSGASTITLSTVGTDTFEDGSSTYTLSNAFESVQFYADTYHNKWVTLFSSSLNNWSKYQATSMVNFNCNITSNNFINFYNDLDMYDSNTGYQFGLISFYGKMSYFNIEDGYPKPIVSEWSQFRAEQTVDISANIIDNVSQLNVDYIYGNGMGVPVTFGTNIDLNNNVISNLQQTDISNLAATNLIARRIYTNNSDDFTINNTTFSNILMNNPISYMNPNSFYTILNCTINFRCNNVKDDLAYFLTLSNISFLSDLSGEMFNDSYPFIENKHNILTSNHSITFQEQFQVRDWADGDIFIPKLFVKSGTGLQTLKNIKFTMVYEPLFS